MPITQTQLDAVREKARDLALAVSALMNFLDLVNRIVNVEDDFQQSLATIESELISKYAAKRAAIVTALGALPVVNP